VEPQKKLIEAPQTQIPTPQQNIAAPPSAIAAPPSAEVPSFVFEGGKAVETTSDPLQLFKGFIEYSIRSKWNRPTDIADSDFIAEVEISVDHGGRISNPEWKKVSGNTRWDASVREALAATAKIDRFPPTNFPPRVVVRFDVQEIAENTLQ
ncbi:MAG: TonB C-terminal domain-containing protein, partial [Limisphaerales bacterium]